ncbi:unnamed protein product [Kuraishia capsulata CBS 1993]|uniref:Uncharacterized protein n=1 Tax=Kuraishia capsulata CBS 1993 TaxID=1382522 RepID=W6MJI9_9ASCO|nr:uncharacterized protein KUCA_T00002678001 [Kuraishia capsulata CBS 1993]CDK26704.1 unnamed protein product [Kuraishia capsulata CBS 1993]
MFTQAYRLTWARHWLSGFQGEMQPARRPSQPPERNLQLRLLVSIDTVTSCSSLHCLTVTLFMDTHLVWHKFNKPVIVMIGWHLFNPSLICNILRYPDFVTRYASQLASPKLIFLVLLYHEMSISLAASMVKLSY